MVFENLFMGAKSFYKRYEFGTIITYKFTRQLIIYTGRDGCEPLIL
jgi:hypothetical protein